MTGEQCNNNNNSYCPQYVVVVGGGEVGTRRLLVDRGRVINIFDIFQVICLLFRKGGGLR